MKLRSRAAVAAAIVALVFDGTGVMTGAAASPLPAKAAKVTVHAAGTTSGVDAAFTPGGAIAGEVTDVHNNPLQSAEVTVLTRSGRSLGSAYTDAAGMYRVTSLPPTTSGYALCVSGANAAATALPVSYGYVSRCAGSSRVWSDGQRPPSDARFIVTPVGTTEPANVILADGGGVTGKITSRESGNNLPGATAYLYLPGGRNNGATYASDGTYQLYGLAPGTYRLCFQPPYASSAHATGYVPQCYHNVAWVNNGSPAANAARVTVTADVATTVNQSLPAAGAITGSVRTATKPAHPLSSAFVEAFAAGKYVNSASPDRDGSYRITNLRPGKYKVCAYRIQRYPAEAARPALWGPLGRSGARFGGPVTPRVAAAARRAASSEQCWKNVAWSGGGVPRKARAVHVHAHQTASGINFRLGRPASPPSAISGRITGPSGGRVAHSVVVVFGKNGRFVAEGLSNGRGTYRLGVAASPKTGYRVCALGPRSQTLDAAARALGARCWRNAPWTGTAAPEAGAMVTVARGHTHHGVDVRLPAAGKITGRATFGGQPVPGIEVIAFDTRGRFASLGVTDDNGNYTLAGMSPSTHAYQVCFVTRQSGSPSTLSPDYGFRPQCYRNRPWSESGIY